MKPNTQQVARAGEHFVAAELNKRVLLHRKGSGIFEKRTSLTWKRGQMPVRSFAGSCIRYWAFRKTTLSKT